MVRDQGRIAIWIKVVTALFLCILVPIYWHHYGPANFLWASDIALFFVCASVWLEKPLPNSMMAVGVLPFELAWIADYLSGAQLIGATDYMFDASRPLYLRNLSLYHLVLPPFIIFLLFRLGYDRRALPAQILLAWIVLPLCYLVTEPAGNVNFVFGPGKSPQTLMPPRLYLALEMVLLPAVVFLPTHLLLRRLFHSGQRNSPAR
jgi:hypothetical protein